MLYTLSDYEIDILTEKIAKRVCKQIPELQPEAYSYIQSICHNEIAQIIDEEGE